MKFLNFFDAFDCVFAFRSGALSLAVLGLGCQDKEVRQAACHVLARLHFHLEGRQVGKDNMLWIRFVEALCKGESIVYFGCSFTILIIVGCFRCGQFTQFQTEYLLSHFFRSHGPYFNKSQTCYVFAPLLIPNS